MIHFWFVLCVTLIIMELLNPGLFFFLALALGAMATFVAQVCDYTYNHEYACFFITSAVAFVILRMLTASAQKESSTSYQSHTHELIGKTIIISEVIGDDAGYAKVDGAMWQVKLSTQSQDVRSLTVGDHVLVVRIKGCHLEVTFIS